MPAKSKAQQKFMGMVHAAQTGEKPASKAVAKVAKSMPKKAAKDFASTKHKGLPKKVKEATDTVEKDEKGNVKSWKHEGDWKPATNKNPRGKVTNASDRARRKTEKLTKAEEAMNKEFETALEGSIRGGVWTSQPPDKGQKDVPPPQEPDGGILNKKQPKPVNAPRPVKKAEVGPQDEAVPADDQEAVAETKKTTRRKAVKESYTRECMDEMDFDSDEMDDHGSTDGGMAREQLYIAATKATKLFKMLQDGQQLPAWISAKITKASDYLDTVAEYIEYETEGAHKQPEISLSKDDIYLESLNSKLKKLM